MEYRRYIKRDKRGNIVRLPDGKPEHDVGWALQIWRVVFRYNKQSSYRGFYFEWGQPHYLIQ